MGNQRVGIFPPKSKILFVLSLALIWCRNFQDRTIPVGGDTWPSCSSERRRRRRRIGKKNKEIKFARARYYRRETSTIFPNALLYEQTEKVVPNEVRERIRIRIKKYLVQGSCFRSNISETVRDIRVSFSLVANGKSHATKRCNPRLCSCYRFWDIVVANIKNFKIFHFDVEQLRICRRTSSHGIIIYYFELFIKLYPVFAQFAIWITTRLSSI